MLPRGRSYVCTRATTALAGLDLVTRVEPTAAREHRYLAFIGRTSTVFPAGNFQQINTGPLGQPGRSQMGDALHTGEEKWKSPESAGIAEKNGQNWYAVHTRARHERAVAHRLYDRGVTAFLPVFTEVHRWHDRKKTMELPVFSCYLFVKLTPCNEEWQRVLRTDSVLGLVGNQGVGTPIPDEQIEAVRILVREKLPCCSHPFLKTGQRVRIRGGALEGLEGIFLSRHGHRRLIISVEAMQRSLAVQVEGYDVEPI
jgi:transcription antitermination factor NusG